MTSDELNCVQAYAAVAQAVSAILALGAAVAVPYIQRRIENKLRLTIKQGFAFPVPTRRGIGRFFFESPQDIRRYIDDGQKVYLAIAIANKSSFPIPIQDIGLTHQKGKGRRYGLAHFIASEDFNEFSGEIQPMGSAIIIYHLNAINSCHSKRARIYVRMVDQEVAYSKPGAWWQYKEISASEAQGRLKLSNPE